MKQQVMLKMHECRERGKTLETASPTPVFESGDMKMHTNFIKTRKNLKPFKYLSHLDPSIQIRRHKNTQTS